ncbi:hypothetical protein TNCV_1794091 [Trichonephila clavipes]|nr:hypothetical protein TNCV_1794091 [Trichonephila clavipes]
MRTRGNRDVYPVAPHTITLDDGQCDDDECTLSMCVHHDATQHECDYLDAINRTWMHLKMDTSSFMHPGVRTDLTIENAPVSDAASKVTATMVSVLRVRAAKNDVELFV